MTRLRGGIGTAVLGLPRQKRARRRPLWSVCALETGTWSRGAGTASWGCGLAEQGRACMLFWKTCIYVRCMIRMPRGILNSKYVGGLVIWVAEGCICDV